MAMSNSRQLGGQLQKKAAMFGFRQEDINKIMHNLVIELTPSVAITLTPGLPAYILFMCIRHADRISDAQKAFNLLDSFINTVISLMRSRNEFGCVVLWFSNTLRLLHLTKQYSKYQHFHLGNTPRQNEQCLRNIELSYYQMQLGKLLGDIFFKIVWQLRLQMEPLVLSSLLEMEDERENRLLNYLKGVHKTLRDHGVDLEIVVQIFRHLFSSVCALSLNELLMKKELCCSPNGMKIRFNVCLLELWARDAQIVMATNALLPIVQVAKLMCANHENADRVCEMCYQLSGNQIITLLFNFTPSNEDESKVPNMFIENMQQKLNKQRGDMGRMELDADQRYPLHFPFNPSNIRLEDIEIPEVLELPMLKKV